MIYLCAAYLFRRHVTDRAHYYAWIRQRFHRLCFRIHATARFLRLQLSKSKIENLHAAVIRDKQILRLQVTMGDAFLVRGSESGGDLLRILNGRAHGQRAFV
ncbi:MAG: hypothetical protein JMDDDDMK_00436 [Acidobacteria bacterium]|nr:hypothetical protein [Acidobacteriota bacterium]